MSDHATLEWESTKFSNSGSTDVFKQQHHPESSSSLPVPKRKKRRGLLQSLFGKVKQKESEFGTNNRHSPAEKALSTQIKIGKGSNDLQQPQPRQQEAFNPFASSSSSSSSSWSSKPPEVPYSSAGAVGGIKPTAMTSGATQHFTIPTPEYLAAVTTKGAYPTSCPTTNLPPNLHPLSSKQNLSSCHSDSIHSISLTHLDDHYSVTSNDDDNHVPPRKPTKWQEFKSELQELVRDLLEYGKAKTWKKKVLAVCLCLSSLFVFYDLFFGQYFIVQWLYKFVVWMTTHSILAVFAFVGIFVFATLIFIPPTLLVFGAGYAFAVALQNFWFGILAATISCFLGSCIGAMIAFLRARYMMRDLVHLFAKRYPLVRAADRALKTNGFRIMLLLRMCPILPFNGLNYICGITGVSLSDFTYSLIGILPFHIYMVVLGSSVGAVLSLDNLRYPNADHTHPEQVGFIVLIVTGIMFGFVAMVYAWKLVKIELQRELELTSEEFQELIHPPSPNHPPLTHNHDGNHHPEEEEAYSYYQHDNLHHSAVNTHDHNNNLTMNLTAAGTEDTMHHSEAEHIASSAIETKYMEDGEVWYWVWA